MRDRNLTAQVQTCVSGCTKTGTVQVGWAVVTRHLVSKAPNNYGVHVVGLNPLGMSTSPGLVIIGNALMELGLVMAVFSAGDMANVPFGGTVHVQPHAREWCVVRCNDCI